MQDEQAHVFFSGHVQGVGFRYTVQQVCRGRGLSGWVKNLPNGEVEAVLAGPGPAVDEAIADIRRIRCDYLDEVRLAKGGSAPVPGTFQIRYGA